MKRFALIRLAGVVLVASMILTGCTSSEKTETANNSSNTNTATTSIDSKGSTFVKAFLENVFEDYKKKSGVAINYAGGGSGAGVTAVIDGTVPFACSDAPMSDEELKKAQEGKAGKVANVPIVLGSIAVLFNVDGVDKLNLDADTLAGIFTLQIKKWNDPKIMALNAGAKLPDLEIKPVVRADGSGSSYVFTDFLSSAVLSFGSSVGKNKKPNWPQGVQAEKGSDGVSKVVKSTPGAITYAELSYAVNGKISYAMIKNKAGQYVLPDAASTTAAAAASKLPEDFRGSIVNAEGAKSYPIASYVFALVPEDMSNNPNAEKVVDALKYVVNEGQERAEGLYYAKLPAEVAKSVADALAKVKVK